MMNYLRQTTEYLIGIYRRWRPTQAETWTPVIQQQIEPLVSDDRLVPAETPLAGKAERSLVQMNFRAVILDRLDECFVCMRRLRFHDPEAYRTFRRIGFSVSSYYVDMDHADIHGLARPTFGGMLIGGCKNDEQNIVPSFIYFRKVQYLKNRVEVFSGDMYQVTVLYQERKKHGNTWQTGTLAAVGEYYLAVSHDGETRLLKQNITTRKTIYPSRNGKRQSPITLPATYWTIPEWLKDIAGKHDTSAEQWASTTFKVALRTHVESLSKCIIRTEKENVAATFGIELQRAPAFFKDRDDAVFTASGSRKKIFHAVIEHQRVLRQKKSITVKSHYRGLRSFQWNGYGVNIVLPENADRFRNIDVTGEWADQANIDKTISEQQFAGHVRDMLKV